MGIDTVRARLGFAWQMFKVVPPKGQAGQTLTEAVNTLGGSLFGEAAKVDTSGNWRRGCDSRAEMILTRAPLLSRGCGSPMT
ncbi:conserved hypothetical protein [Magnetospirillum molischianum DSM 120]|uniref:Uncharacterized protein n=1 Tax=Magnetospirillum molischianum DSM 120 TaxID=1150626 RepID=H8FQR4_MAGML|nr:conserved hypothetical protein [Magnetospirillum molischianum DSM 120]